MRFEFGSTGDPEAMMEAEVRSAEVAVTRGVQAAGAGLKAQWRADVSGSGLGKRLANSIRARNYPGSGESIRAASLVFSNASEILDAHDRGALIRSKDGFWLAIPTDAAARLRGAGNKRVTPRIFEQRTGLRLRFVYRPGKTGLLVADQARINTKGTAAMKRGRRRKDGILTGEATVVAFILVPQVKLRRRLDLSKAATAWSERLPGLIVDNWKEAGRA